MFAFYNCGDSSSEKEKDMPQKARIANEEIVEFKDSFDEKIASFWGLQLAKSDRAMIVKDPLNSENEVLKVTVTPTDRVSGGNRSEFVIKQHDSMGYLNKYAFKFMLPEAFFKEQEKDAWFIIHQWHDEPAPGFTWATKKDKTKPPIALTISYSPEEGYQLYYKDGLDTGTLDEAKRLIWTEELKANVWYTFSNSVFWSLYETHGYSEPRLNGELFTPDKNAKLIEGDKIFGRNMYNAVGNYFKFGLYQASGQIHARHIYFDDFTMQSKRVSYWIE
ncbi:MAG: heparin lyase I family protein [Gilvibacter sp.]